MRKIEYKEWGQTYGSNYLLTSPSELGAMIDSVVSAVLNQIETTAKLIDEPTSNQKKPSP
jgi:hypothetical protein